MALSRASLALGAALVLGSVQGALAADLNGGSLKDAPAPAYEPVRSAPSVYFRIDGGYAAYDTPVMTEDGIFQLNDEEIDNTWSLGGGVGMSLGHGFRGDVTYERRFEADAYGNVADPLNNLYGSREFGIESDVFLANLYYDLDTSSRWTPYVGVGLGVTKNKTTDGTVEDPCGCVIGTIDSNSESHAAGALMAGVALNLRGGSTHPGHGRGLVVDFGYRFLYLGEAETGAVRAEFTAPHPTNGGVPGDVVSNDPLVENIHAHEIRMGLRYNLN
jgi:opacity protein-like surface antigen